MSYVLTYYVGEGQFFDKLEPHVLYIIIHTTRSILINQLDIIFGKWNNEENGNGGDVFFHVEISKCLVSRN